MDNLIPFKGGNSPKCQVYEFLRVWYRKYPHLKVNRNLGFEDRWRGYVAHCCHYRTILKSKGEFPDNIDLRNKPGKPFTKKDRNESKNDPEFEEFVSDYKEAMDQNISGYNDMNPIVGDVEKIELV